MFMLTSRYRRDCKSYETDIRHLRQRLKVCEDTERSLNGTRLLKSICACRQVAQGIMHPDSEEAALALTRLAHVEGLLNDLAQCQVRDMSEAESVAWGLAINEVPANPAWLYGTTGVSGADPE